MYPTIKLAALIVGLLVLVGCGSGGKIEFTGEYDPESGIVSVDLGNGTASSSVAVELPEVSWPPEGGTLPPVDLPGLIEEPAGGPFELITIDPSEHPAEFLRGIFKKCVNSQAVYLLSEQHGLEAQERRYTAHEEGKH